MMVEPARTQTKLILYVFSSVLLLVLIISLAYKYGYSNLFSPNTSGTLSLTEPQQNVPIEIKMVPSASAIQVGESVVYSLESAEDLSFLGLSLKLQASAATTAVSISEEFTVNVPNATTLLNSISQADGTTAELVFLTLSTTTPLTLTAGETFAEITMTPSVAGESVVLEADQEASFITMIEDQTRPIVFNFEPVIVLE